MQIKLKWKKDKHDIDVDTTQSPLDFKVQVYSLTGLPPDQQKLIFRGHILKDDDEWASIDLRKGMVVMLVETHGGQELQDAEMAQVCCDHIEFDSLWSILQHHKRAESKSYRSFTWSGS